MIEAAERAIQTDPNRTRVWTGLYNELAWCKMKLGDAESVLFPCTSRRIGSIRAVPTSSSGMPRWVWHCCCWAETRTRLRIFERSLAMHPVDMGAPDHRRLAAAYAR